MMQLNIAAPLPLVFQGNRALPLLLSRLTPIKRFTCYEKAIETYQT
jgi:hypothetical protein